MEAHRHPGQDWVVIVVENKIDTQDHSEQLSRYKRVAQNLVKPIVCVYLTPDEPAERMRAI